MTIKTNIRTLLESASPLREISNLALKGKTAFRFAKVINIVNVELAATDEALKNLREQYMENEKPPVVYKGKNKAERLESEAVFSSEFEELMNTEVELNTEQIEPSVLDNVEGVKPITLSSLKWLWLSED